MHMLEQNQGQDHVSAQDQAFENMSLHGPDVYVCPGYGDGLKLTMQSANKLLIGTGALLVNGRYCIVDPAETLTVDNGATGMTERDLVCVHWKVTANAGTKTQQEQTEIVIVKGTPASSGATDPTIANKVIKPGVSEAWVPFARITKDGLTPTVALIVPSLVSEAEFRDSVSQASKTSSSVSIEADSVGSFSVDFGKEVIAVTGIRPSQITMMDVSFWSASGSAVTVGVHNLGAKRTGTVTVSALVKA